MDEPDNAPDNDAEQDEATEELDEDAKRAITYQIAKNRGLTPHKKKELRNPRVKHRMKFRKAVIRRKGQVMIKIIINNLLYYWLIYFLPRFESLDMSCRSTAERCPASRHQSRRVWKSSKNCNQRPGVRLGCKIVTVLFFLINALKFKVLDCQ